MDVLWWKEEGDQGRPPSPPQWRETPLVRQVFSKLMSTTYYMMEPTRLGGSLGFLYKVVQVVESVMTTSQCISRADRQPAFALAMTQGTRRAVCMADICMYAVRRVVGGTSESILASRRGSHAALSLFILTAIRLLITTLMGRK